ncbi:MAG TPA: hypothetical protein VGJ91_02200, partial [Polyangiaceae bacterium]
MDPHEVRAIRGSLSRATFAKLLGVTSLTVLRWELAEGTKEARRPRAKMVEELRKLADAGGGQAPAPPVDSVSPNDDDDDDASEPALPSQPPPNRVPIGAELDALQRDQGLLLPLLEKLGYESWPQAEDALLDLLSSRALTSHAGRCLATLGLVQAQFFGRLDTRTALATLLPILSDAEQGKLEASVAARAHVLAVLLFGGPDSRCFDLGRVNVHAERAEQLLTAEDSELRCLLAAGRVISTRFMGPQAVMVAFRANQSSLDGGPSLLSRLIAESLRGLFAMLSGDQESALRHTEAGVAIAERMRLFGLLVAMLADRAGRMLRGTWTPSQVLELTRQARELAERHQLAPSEPLIRVFGHECEALARMALFDQALALGAEAEALARRGGVVLSPLAAPLVRTCAFTHRTAELTALAEAFEHDTPAGRGPLNVHALLARSATAGVAGEYGAEAELLEQICSAPDTTPGLDYVLHDAHIQLTVDHVLMRDQARAQAALRRAEQFYEQRPSVWHAAQLRRIHGFALLAAGRL